jgi:hypothetical protein
MFVKCIYLHIYAIEEPLLNPKGNQSLNYIRLILKINFVNNEFPGNRNKIRFRKLCQLFNRAFTFSITCGKLPASCPPAVANVF